MSIERAKLPRIPFTWMISMSSATGSASCAIDNGAIPAPNSTEIVAASRVLLKVISFIIALLIFRTNFKILKFQ